MKPRKVRVRLAIAGLGLSLGLGAATHAPAATQASPAPKGPPVIYQKARSFRVPFRFDPAERSRWRELQLWVSDDLGRNWRQRGVTTPDRPAFTFNAEHDGEYWLAVRRLDTQGRLFPGDDVRIEPNMKVIVDTKPPVITLEPQARSASLASVRWEVRDDHPDESHPPVLQYQLEGSKEWLQVPIDEGGQLGVATWDAGVTDPLKVRATAVDRAGNKAETILGLESSRPGQTPVAATEPKPSTAPQPAPAQEPGTSNAAQAVPTPQPEPAPRPAPVAATEATPTRPAAPEGNEDGSRAAVPLRAGAQEQAAAEAVPSTHGGQIDGRRPIAAPVYPSAQDVAAVRQPVSLPPAAIKQFSIGPGPVASAQTVSPPEEQRRTGPLGSALPMRDRAAGDTGDDKGSKVAEELRPDLSVPRVEDLKDPKPANSQTLQGQGADPDVGVAGLGKPVEPAGQPEAMPPGGVNKLKVPGQRFLLDYAVDRAGPDGRPAVVELWVTEDGGQSWKPLGTDPDCVSPILVDLHGAGTYGITLIARDENGLGDKPPVPGEEPKMWIEVGSPEQASRPPNLLQRAMRR